MKTLSILCFALLSFCVTAQEKTAPAIKIYLEDAETEKNIADAKVTLEGFEIPAITGKYDKTGKYYYFDKIPAGYNTIMAYHKKYNEKGFQNIEGLPKELKLRLYDPLNVSYNYHSNTYKDYFQTIYVEDPYKIAISSSDLQDYNLFKDYLYKEIEKLDLDIEVVNPYLELDKNKKIPYCFGKNLFSHQTEAYPNIETLSYLTNFILPLTRGYSTSEYYYDARDYTITAKEVAIYFRKKNGAKFKRFNEPILKKIRTIEGITTSSIIYYKHYFEDEKRKKNYKNYYTKKLDRRNHFTNIDSSKVFFYYNFHNVELLKIPTNDKFGMSVHSYYPTPNEFLIRYRPNILIGLNKDINGNEIKISNCKEDIFNLDAAIGLGILDQYEKISDCLKQKF